ncbi:ABC transporter ATP-binding protein [Rugosimonospora acidiphila]|uniref:ABC transporter ATP-binding protein n=1 Tax=Rugosimonospora acidiphila TaxID=556531 RepID=A0ABP9RPR6_9ACTN
MLTVENLTRRFERRVILDRISFTLTPGEVCAVIGANGSGKTTLLRCVVGAERPDGGRVRLDGRPMDETDPEIRAAVACVLDDIDFFPDLSAGEHLDLLAYAHGGRQPGAVDEVIAELGLTEARDQLPSTLSSGQRRRLALASCFVRPHRLLVLDEPEQRLDVEGRDWLARALAREREAGTAVLFASHDADLVAAVADSHLTLGQAEE